jgi:adenylate cyclase
MNISDPYADPRFNREVDRKTGYRTHSILCTPIVNRDGEKLGVLQVLNRKGGVFDERDEQRLRAFASQISIALENARLFESVLNARNYNESILRSLSNGVITLDSDLVVIKVNDAAGRILGAAPDALTGEPIQVVLGAENDAVAASLARVAETGKPDILVDQDLELRDGSSVATNVTVAPLIDVQDEPIGYMVVLEDISREKRIKGTMARYMTREVMDRLLESGDSVLGGSMQEATILFSDIRGFTSMSEALGPRETVSMLNEYFTDMVDVIFDNGGILDKYIGDGLMALFGLPFPGEDDADKAVSVASGMISALRQLNWKRERKGLKHINIGVGVSSGEVIAGNIGSPKRMDYTVIGDCVNLASRLETANKHYGTRVLLCENTAKRLRNDWMLREIAYRSGDAWPRLPSSRSWTTTQKKRFPTWNEP